MILPPDAEGAQLVDVSEVSDALVPITKVGVDPSGLIPYMELDTSSHTTLRRFLDEGRAPSVVYSAQLYAPYPKGAAGHYLLYLQMRDAMCEPWAFTLAFESEAEIQLLKCVADMCCLALSDDTSPEPRTDRMKILVFTDDIRFVLDDVS